LRRPRPRVLAVEQHRGETALDEAPFSIQKLSAGSKYVAHSQHSGSAL